MLFLVVGINWSKANSRVREKFTFTKDEVLIANRHLNERMGVLQNVILSTCNRTEIYAIVKTKDDISDVIEFLSELKNIPVGDFENYLDIHTDKDAVGYLYKVASGIKSKVVGETQILGQIKESFELAQKANSTKKHLNELFKRAIAFAKKSHSKYQINDNPISTSYVAVQAAKGMFTNGLKGKTVAVIGVGETARLAIAHLQHAKVEKVIVLNRTFEKIVPLVKKFGVEAAPFSLLSDTLCKIDVVITATSSQEYIINAEMLKNVQEKRGKKPLLVMDISMPLNVEPVQKNNEYMRLMNLDHLSNIVDDNILMRRKKALLIELDAESEVKSFEKWMKELRAIPIIKQLNAYTSVLKTEVALKLEQEITLSKKERIIITQQISITLNQVLSRSIEVVKDHALEDKEFSWESINNFFQQERKHG